MRVITYVLVQIISNEVVYLARIYDKLELESLPDTELKQIIQELTDDEADPA